MSTLLLSTSCSRSRDMFPCWSQLLPEILDDILKRLSLPDCFNFAKVSISWQSVFVDRCCLTRPPPCMILTAPCAQTPRNLWGLNGGQQLQKLCSPKSKLLGSHDIVGTFECWLVIAHYRFNGLHLFNPESNQWIPLPSRTSNGLWMQCYKGFCTLQVDLSAPPTAGQQCILLARGWFPSLAWCRLGDSEWTAFPDLPVGFKFYGALFHKSELHVMSSDGDILVYSFNSQPEARVAYIVPPNPFTCSGCEKTYHWIIKRLVETDAGILLVMWHYGGLGDDDGFQVVTLNVFKEQEGKGWIKLENLGDKFLLIGSHSSKFLCTQDYMGSRFEANCIYYVHNINLVKFSLADQTSHRIPLPYATEWITYPMNDGSFERDRLRHVLKTVCWITPESW